MSDAVKSLFVLARPKGFEPLTFAFGGQAATLAPPFLKLAETVVVGVETSPPFSGFTAMAPVLEPGVTSSKVEKLE